MFRCGRRHRSKVGVTGIAIYRFAAGSAAAARSTAAEWRLAETGLT